MGKPDWKDAPEWAQWLAQDSSGSWGWYQKKPVIRSEGTFVWDIESTGDNWVCPCFEKPNIKWAETLERRP